MEGLGIISGGHDLCPQESAKLSMTLFKNIPRYGYRAARLEWRANFLALYASWHARLLGAPQIDLREIWQKAAATRITSSFKANFLSCTGSMPTSMADHQRMSPGSREKSTF
jgi:hypothetical protein